MKMMGYLLCVCDFDCDLVVDVEAAGDAVVVRKVRRRGGKEDLKTFVSLG